MAFIDRKPLLRYLRSQFAIDWHGHHGAAHWARVRANGLMLAPKTGANRHVVELFAFFHDSRRVNEHEDNGHGERGAVFAAQLKGRFFEASDDEMDLLRVGIRPRADRLCTEAARQPGMLAVANGRAQAWVAGHRRRGTWPRSVLHDAVARA